MTITQTTREDVLITEYKKVAQELYPLILEANSEKLRNHYAIAFGNVLGTPGEFFKYVSDSGNGYTANISSLLERFSHNITLLISKTWVEAADEKHKTILFEKLELFSNHFFHDENKILCKDFICLSEDTLELMFGEQVKSKDFIKYAFRIDPRFGLFTWFLENLKESLKSANPESLKTLLLLGMYFLASF